MSIAITILRNALAELCMGAAMRIQRLGCKFAGPPHRGDSGCEHDDTPPADYPPEGTVVTYSEEAIRMRHEIENDPPPVTKRADLPLRGSLRARRGE